METLLAADIQLFLFINHLPHNEIFDGLALFFSGIGKAGFIWFVLGLWLFQREEKKNHGFFAPILFAGGVSWLLTEGVLKPLIGRLRPDAQLGAIVVGNGASWFAFPSSHATIAWAFVVVLSKYEPRWKLWFTLLAIAISLSRTYLGVHYPLDVLAGSLLGVGIGKLALSIKRPQKAKKPTR